VKAERLPAAAAGSRGTRRLSTGGAVAASPLAGIASLAILQPLLLLVLLPLAAAQPEQQQSNSSTLAFSEAFISSGASGKAVFAPEVALGGEPLALVTAKNGHGCAQACRGEEDCGWFNYCEVQVRTLGRARRRVKGEMRVKGFIILMLLGGRHMCKLTAGIASQSVSCSQPNRMC